MASIHKFIGPEVQLNDTGVFFNGVGSATRGEAVTLVRLVNLNDVSVKIEIIGDDPTVSTWLTPKESITLQKKATDGIKNTAGGTSPLVYGTAVAYTN